MSPTGGPCARKELFLLVFPDALGNPYAGIPSYEKAWWLYHEKACYVGLVTLGLIVVGLARRRRYPWQLPMSALCAFDIDARDGLVLAALPADERPPPRPHAVPLPRPGSVPSSASSPLSSRRRALKPSSTGRRPWAADGRGPPSWSWACWLAAPPR